MLNISIRSHVVEMKKGYGSFGGGSATLEKSKLDLSQSSSKVKQEMLDRKYVEVILQEWLKTISDLPEGFRLAVELMR